MRGSERALTLTLQTAEVAPPDRVKGYADQDSCSDTYIKAKVWLQLAKLYLSILFFVYVNLVSWWLWHMHMPLCLKWPHMELCVHVHIICLLCLLLYEGIIFLTLVTITAGQLQPIKLNTKDKCKQCANNSTIVRKKHHNVNVQQRIPKVSGRELG